METELHLPLRRRLLQTSLLETVESVPQLVIQCIFISELRASHDLLLSDGEYALLITSPCISAVNIVKCVGELVAIELGRRHALASSDGEEVSPADAGGRMQELSPQAQLGIIRRNWEKEGKGGAFEGRLRQEVCPELLALRVPVASKTIGGAASAICHATVPLALAATQHSAAGSLSTGPATDPKMQYNKKSNKRTEKVCVEDWREGGGGAGAPSPELSGTGPDK